LDKSAKRAATASADFTARVWDALNGNELHSFVHKHIVKSVGFNKVIRGGLRVIF
jgi:serine-threonine kinase receptor-associated protein